MSGIFKRAGLSTFANQDAMSRIRGGNNFLQLRVADGPVCCPREKCDIIVALDKGSVYLHTASLTENGVIVADNETFRIDDVDKRLFNVPFRRIVAQMELDAILINSVACGVLTGLTGVPFDFAAETLRSFFSKKGDKLIDANFRAAKAGNEFVHAQNRENHIQVPALPDHDRLLMSGNDALALGAIKAGCRFYSAYPMSPSTDIMETMCRFAPDYKIVVEQAEDEIAAVNMVIGASFAGVRAMTGTSGGGFALMGEGISLAGMTETPLVIVNGQRPAPATGLPTRTEQADLDLAIHSGHGEFARAVFAPGTVEEAFTIMVHAFEMADKFQIPVVVLSDQYLADSQTTVDPKSLTGPAPIRHLLSKDESQSIELYRRYALTESGISPRAVPSWIKDPIYVDSDEHTEEGHITEDADVRVVMVQKRFHKKMALLEKEIIAPTAVNGENADLVLVGFGSTYGVMREAAETTTSQKIGFLHLSQVWPFPAGAVTAALEKANRVVTVENNAGAQLAKLLRRETGIVVNGSILKYDGRPFAIDFLIRELNRGQ
jgi:2-oxoglutarate ferredoxin oxidoreductase subunit alpha